MSTIDPKRKRSVKDVRREELDDLRTVLNTLQGRRFLWRVIHEFRPLTNMWNAQGSQMGLNAAYHDCGLYLIKEVNDANPEAMITMATEFRRRSKEEEAAEKADAKEKKEEEISE